MSVFCGIIESFLVHLLLREFNKSEGTIGLHVWNVGVHNYLSAFVSLWVVRCLLHFSTLIQNQWSLEFTLQCLWSLGTGHSTMKYGKCSIVSSAGCMRLYLSLASPWPRLWQSSVRQQERPVLDSLLYVIEKHTSLGLSLQSHFLNPGH